MIRVTFEWTSKGGVIQQQTFEQEAPDGVVDFLTQVSDKVNWAQQAVVLVAQAILAQLTLTMVDDVLTSLSLSRVAERTATEASKFEA